MYQTVEARAGVGRYTAGPPHIPLVGPVSFEWVTRPGARHANHSSLQSRKHLNLPGCDPGHIGRLEGTALCDRIAEPGMRLKASGVIYRGDRTWRNLTKTNSTNSSAKCWVTSVAHSVCRRSASDS